MNIQEEVQKFFEQFSGDVPNRASLYAGNPNFRIDSLRDPEFVCDIGEHEWISWVGIREGYGTDIGSRCINCGLIRW